MLVGKPTHDSLAAYRGDSLGPETTSDRFVVMTSGLNWGSDGKNKITEILFLISKCFRSFEAKFAKPGKCGDRIVTIVVQVKDSYGATAICGGTSHPEGVHPCPTAVVDPFAGTTKELLEDLKKATESVGQNLFSSSDMLAKTMAVKKARGEKCRSVSSWLSSVSQHICPASMRCR